MTTAEIVLFLVSVIEALIIYIWVGMKEDVKKHGKTIDDHERRLIKHETANEIHLKQVNDNITFLKEEFKILKAYIHEKEHKETDLINQQKHLIQAIWNKLENEHEKQH